MRTTTALFATAALLVAPPLPDRIDNDGATATVGAVRLDPPDLEPVIDPQAECRQLLDGLAWEWRNAAVGRIAYDVGTACRGWPREVADRWRPFVHGDVWAGESGWCWNLLGGGHITTDLGCVMGRVGTGEDAGIGQVTASWWGRNGRVCLDLGYCSRHAVIASPYDSVMAALYVIEVGGDQAYCYDDRSRRYHPTCAQFPGRWP
jgi:hypothetical protein